MSNQKRFGAHFQYSRCEISQGGDILESEWNSGTMTRSAGKKRLSVLADGGQDGLLVVLTLNGKFSKRRPKATTDRIYAAAGVKQ